MTGVRLLAGRSNRFSAVRDDGRVIGWMAGRAEFPVTDPVPGWVSLAPGSERCRGLTKAVDLMLETDPRRTPAFGYVVWIEEEE